MFEEGEPENPRLRRQIQAMNGSAFEEFIADLWASDGWDTEVTAATRDHGVDVIAHREETVDQRLGIQAKAYTENAVSEDIIREYLGVKHQNYDIDAVVVVTSSRFTEPAREYAEEHNIKLVNLSDIIDLVERTNSRWLVQQYSSAEDSAEAEEQSSIDEAGFLAIDEDRPERYRGLMGTIRLVRDYVIVKYYHKVHGESRDEISRRLKNR